MEQTTEEPIDLMSTLLDKALLVHCYGERRVVLPRVTAYQVKLSIKALRLGSLTNVLACCRCREASFEEITFETTLTENEERYEIAPAAWETMVHKLQVVWVKVVHDNARGSVPQRLIGKPKRAPYRDTHGRYRHHLSSAFERYTGDSAVAAGK
jgi:hypothetical protein